MITSAFVTYMSSRLSADLTREQILDMTNKAQNEILGHSNRITRIVPDPFIHTGSDDLVGDSGNTLGNILFKITTVVDLDTPSAGFIQVTNGDGTVEKYKYVSINRTPDDPSDAFVLADGVTLLKTYVGSEGVKVDIYDIVASGALFSSIKNDSRVQYDVRSVTRVYALRSKVPGYNPFGFGRFNQSSGSFRPNQLKNYNGVEIDITADSIQSFEPLSNDCRVVEWRDNPPPDQLETDQWICRAQRWPTQLTNEDVPLMIPDRFQTNLLRFAILKDEEYREYGRDDNPEERYEKYLDQFLTWAEGETTTTTPTKTLPRF
ncbi:MAG: hypothetical protein ACTSW1_05460 [Candidatus Hodarchaeales archaeon]